MLRVGSALLIGLLVGALAARLLSTSESPPAEAVDPLAGSHAEAGTAGDASEPASGDARIEALLSELAAERVARVQLEAQLEALRHLYGEEDEASPNGSNAGASAFEGALEDSPPPVSEYDPKAEDPWFREDVLRALGFSDSEIERIRLRWEQLTMDELYAKDEQARGDGPGRGALRRQIEQLKRGAQEELGDHEYDAMLYATGQRNRVLLKDVLRTSPGFEAGLRPGDQVISYDGERIYTPLALKTLTRRGHPDRLVEVRVLRDGELVRAFVPAGPMGTQLSFGQAAPYLY
jgi:hypothetical protein